MKKVNHYKRLEMTDVILFRVAKEGLFEEVIKWRSGWEKKKKKKKEKEEVKERRGRRNANN